MKNLFGFIVVMFAMLAMTTQSYAQQYSVRRIVRAEFLAGTLSIPNDTLCFLPGQQAQLITGTAAIGGIPGTTYQWQYSLNAGAWSTFTSPLDTNFMTSVTLNPGDHHYRRIDTNPGCGIDTTNTITIHVWPPFVAGIATGGGDFCYNEVGTTTTCVTATGANPSTITSMIYTSPDDSTWTATGNNTLSFTPSGPMTHDLYVKWEFTSNCGIVESNTILYQVYDPFVAGIVSTTTVSPICNGTNGGTATTTTATGGNTTTTTMEWEISHDGSIFANTGNNTNTYPFNSLTAPTWVRVRYMNECDTVFSTTLFIDVYDVLAHSGPSTLIGNNTICLNLSPGSITGPTTIGGAGNYSYQWKESFNGATFTDIIGDTLEDYVIPTLTAGGTYKYFRVTTDNCGSINSDTTTVFVYNALNAGVVGTHADVCSGSIQDPIIEMTPATGGSGNYSYQWILSTDNEASFNDITGANDPNYTPATVTTPVELYYYYRRTVIDNVCSTTETSTAPALP